LIDSYVKANPEQTIVFDSLGQLRYLSAMQYVDGVVGNSSSGLLEAPSFKIGTINIGDRQKGRIKATSVIDCLPTESSIMQALNKLFSEQFYRSVKNTINPFGEGGVSEKIVKTIENIPLDKIIKKEFYNITG